MPKITVIMPSLNVADYIEPCISSVVNQTFEDLEILCIDAGSTDGTLEILREYEARDSRVHMIVSERKSYGYQVNLGISMAHGDYIGIVETDDIIETDMFQVLYEAVSSEKMDYAKGAFQVFAMFGQDCFLQSPYFLEWEEDETSRKICPRDMSELLMLDPYLWNGIYRTEFIQDVRLNESAGAAFQDLGFIYQVYVKASKAVYLRKPVYNYRQDNPNNSCASPKAFQYIMQELSYILQLPMAMSEEWRVMLYYKIMKMICGYFQKMSLTNCYWEEAESDISQLCNIMRRACADDKVYKKCKDTYGEELDMFLEDPHSLYVFLNQRYLKKAGVFQEILKKPQPYVVFGSGAYGEFVYMTLRGKGKSPVAFCDNDNAKCGTLIYGTPVMSVEKAVEENPSATFIIASKYYAAEMQRQLLDLGVIEQRTVAYTLPTDWMMFYRFV